MKLLTKLLGFSIIAIALIFIGAIFLIFEHKPMLQGDTLLTPERIAHGKQVFEQNDPRRLKSGTITQVNLDQEDLDVALNYFADQVMAKQGLDMVTDLKIEHGHAFINGTVQLPNNPLGRYLNFKLKFDENEKIPKIDHLWLGKLWVPGKLAERLMQQGLTLAMPYTDVDALYAMLRSVKFEKKQVKVAYQWQKNLPIKFSDVILSNKDQDRMVLYQQQLIDLTRNSKRTLPLIELMQPLFKLAQKQSLDGDAIEENRAAILVLAFYVNQKNLNQFMPDLQTLRRPRWRNVTLNSRDDFPKHYLVSALLAAYAGTPLADAVGLFKEMEDAKQGSGFSFNDIAADRAGTRMGAGGQQ